MPTRLLVVLLSCLLSAAAPFVAPRDPPPAKRMMGIDVVFAARNRALDQMSAPVRHQFMPPLALPIIDEVASVLFILPTWPELSEILRTNARRDCCDHMETYEEAMTRWGLADARTVQLRRVPCLSANSRGVTLSIDTAGSGRWDTTLVELWITGDGWNWHLLQCAPAGDSLAASLPAAGRFGLRVVVHKLNGPASPTPRTADIAQVWIEADERSSILGIGKDEYSSPGKLFYSPLHLDQPADVKQVKQDGLLHPCGYVKRIESKRIVKPQPYRPYQQFTF